MSSREHLPSRRDYDHPSGSSVDRTRSRSPQRGSGRYDDRSRDRPRGNERYDRDRDGDRYGDNRGIGPRDGYGASRYDERSRDYRGGGGSGRDKRYDEDDRDRRDRRSGNEYRRDEPAREGRERRSPSPVRRGKEGYRRRLDEDGSRGGNADIRPEASTGRDGPRASRRDWDPPQNVSTETADPYGREGGHARNGRAEPPSQAPNGAKTEEEPVEEEDAGDIAAMMGFGGFGTTKGKSTGQNADGAVNVNRQRTWRQYMNRPGGFNRPLDKMK